MLKTNLLLAASIFPQRIARPEFGEHGEVPVRCPLSTDAAARAQRGDAMGIKGVPSHK